MFGISNQCRKADVKNYDGNIDACKYIKIIQLRKKKYEWKPNLKGQDYKQCELTFHEYDINCKVAPIFTLSMIYCTFGLKNNSDWKK